MCQTGSGASSEGAVGFMGEMESKYGPTWAVTIILSYIAHLISYARVCVYVVLTC